MKFSISSTALSSKLQNLAKALSAKPSIPILNNFLFEIVDGVLTLTTSDSETTMKATMPLDESDSNGRFTIPSRTILDATRELPEQPLHFDINLETMAVQITYQNGVYNFTAQTAAEYPTTKELAGDAASVQLESAVLLNSTLYFIMDKIIRVDIASPTAKGNLSFLCRQAFARQITDPPDSSRLKNHIEPNAGQNSTHDQGACRDSQKVIGRISNHQSNNRHDQSSPKISFQEIFQSKIRKHADQKQGPDIKIEHGNTKVALKQNPAG